MDDRDQEGMQYDEAFDDHSLAMQVERLHHPDGHCIEVRPLLRHVQDVIDLAILAVEGGLVSTISSSESSSEVPELPLIVKRITCVMTCKVRSGVDAHNTTLAVLGNLQQFSWEAKAVLTLAAFAVTYGHFWLLFQICSSHSLGNAIKRLPMVVEGNGAFKQHFKATNNLIKAMIEITRCIIEFEDLPAMYVSPDNPAIKAALNRFPNAVYYIVRSAVSATNITTMSTTELEYNESIFQSLGLSNWAQKLKSITEHLRKTLSKLYQLIEEKKEIEALYMVRKHFYDTIHVDNMLVLRVLVDAKNNDVTPLYDGVLKKRVDLNVLIRRNVLLLISGLDITPNDLSMLKQNCTAPKDHSYVIVFIPIIDDLNNWTDDEHDTFENLKTSMPWYSIHHPSMIGNTIKRFIREDWNYRGSPILVVLDPKGNVVNPNAIHMMWTWQSQAFPYTRAREEDLWAKETWRLELLFNGIDGKILDWITEEKYIFVFGNVDIDWISSFRKEAQAVARALEISVEMVYVGKSDHKEYVRKVTEDIMTEQLCHYWQDPILTWKFWKRIECMIYAKVQLRKDNIRYDEILHELQRLHSLDKSYRGWAILAKGSKIVIHDDGKFMLKAIRQTKHLKESASTKGFDVGFKKVVQMISQEYIPCHRIEFPSQVKLPKIILCPTCLRIMIRSSSYHCCHQH